MSNEVKALLDRKVSKRDEVSREQWEKEGVFNANIDRIENALGKTDSYKIDPKLKQLAQTVCEKLADVNKRQLEGNRENKAIVASELKAAVDALGNACNASSGSLPPAKRGLVAREAKTLLDLSTQMKIVISLRLGSPGDVAVQLSTLVERCLNATLQVLLSIESQ